MADLPTLVHWRLPGEGGGNEERGSENGSEHPERLGLISYVCRGHGNGEGYVLSIPL